MKKINFILNCLLLTASVCCTQQAIAQAPQKMSYQFVIRNSNNVLLANTTVGVQISVLQGNASGNAVYVETQTGTTNGNGLVSIQIGTGTVISGTFAGINWASGPYFIKTETDPAGEFNYTITGTQEILSVPYAMYAAKSGDATTMGAIGSSSSTNGGTITAGVLSLTPADGSNGGIVTTATQTFAGNKTLTGTLGVGTTTPATSAQLDVSSTTKGLLPPRMTGRQRNSIPGPVAGLVIFCTDCGEGVLQVYNGSFWTSLTGGAATTNNLAVGQTTINKLAVGQSYGGGVIAYILQYGDPGYDPNIPHGLIAATHDQGPFTGNYWCNATGSCFFVTNASGTAIGTGLSNTNTIIASQGGVLAEYAAGLARTYTGGGYFDWYLPSKDELYKLYLNRALIGNFTADYYWSSSEFNYGNAFYVLFYNGAQDYFGKNDTFYVRAVRAF